VVQLTEKQDELCGQTPWDFSDLSAVFINRARAPLPVTRHPPAFDFPNPDYR
jgi:hypothetical protein